MRFVVRTPLYGRFLVHSSFCCFPLVGGRGRFYVLCHERSVDGHGHHPTLPRFFRYNLGHFLYFYVGVNYYFVRRGGFQVNDGHSYGNGGLSLPTQGDQTTLGCHVLVSIIGLFCRYVNLGGLDYDFGLCVYRFLVVGSSIVFGHPMG